MIHRSILLSALLLLAPIQVLDAPAVLSYPNIDECTGAMVSYGVARLAWEDCNVDIVDLALSSGCGQLYTAMLTAYDNVLLACQISAG